MELILGLLLTWPVTIILVVFALVFEHKQAHGWTVIATLAIVTFACIMIEATLIHVGIAAAVWVPIGLVWSFWRWKRFVDTAVDECNPSDTWALDTTRSKIDPSNNVDTIVYWIIAWPISLISMTLGDVFDAIGILVKKIFRGTYTKISTKGLASLEDKLSK